MLMTKEFTCKVLVVAAILLIAPPSRAYEQQLQQLSAELAEEISAAQKKTIAVVDFTDLRGNVTELGRFLAEELSVSLAAAHRGFEVVDRTHLAVLLREHKLSRTGLIDPQTAKELGKIAGVEALITGTLTRLGDSIRIAIKILDTESAKIIGSTTGNIAKTAAIDDLLNRGISVGPGISDNPPEPAVGGQQTVESNEFTFSLQKCEMVSEKVTCSILITNKSEDRQLGINGYSRIFDESGAEHSAKMIQLGDNSLVYSRYIQSSKVRKELISGVPTQAIAIFENVSPNIARLTVLELVCGSDIRGGGGSRISRGEDFRVQFRNIVLSRR